MIWVVLVVIGYIFGSIPVGYLIAKSKGINIQEEGSGNIGATNIARVMGIKAGITTFVLDVSKGLLPVLIVQYLTGSREMGLVAGVCAIAGHLFSVFLKFKGGKAVATTLGFVLALQPGLGGIVFGLWVFFLIAGGRVSVASIMAAVYLAVLSLILEPSTAIKLTTVVISAYIIFKHRSNIKRLLKGKESTIWEDMMRKKWAKDPPKPGVFRAGFLFNTTDDPEFFKAKASQKFPKLKKLPTWVVFKIFRKVFPIVFYSMGKIVIHSSTGQKVEILFHGVPLTASELKNQPASQTVPKIAQAVQYCIERGATIVGLGAYTAIAGGGGQIIGQMFGTQVAITTGNGYTAVSGTDTLLSTARVVGYDLSQETVAIIGAGAVGRSVAILLAKQVKELLLVTASSDLAGFISQHGITNARQVSLEDAIKGSRLIITVTSATGELQIDSKLFLPGTIIVDLARPRDIAEKVDKDRPDVLVLDGGIIAPSWAGEQTFNFGFPPGLLFACMSETAMFALEGYHSGVYSISDQTTPEWLMQLKMLALKHGFGVVGRRQFDLALPPERLKLFLQSARLKEA